MANHSTFFKNKVAIVTGSSMGIGKAIAFELAQVGAKVVLTGRNSNRLNQTLAEMHKNGWEAIAFQGDVSNWEDNQRLMKQTISTFGQLDILVNNAGLATRGGLEDLHQDVLQSVMDVNVLGTIFPSKAAIPYLKARQGSIINISSIASFYGLPYNSVYCASKKALTAFTQSLRLEVKSDNIHVGIIYVGFTENDPKKEILDADGKKIYLENRQGVKKQSPQQVAFAVLNAIAKRKSSVTLSIAGKALGIISRLMPGLIRFIYTKNLAKIKANSSGKPRYVSNS